MLLEKPRNEPDPQPPASRTRWQRLPRIDRNHPRNLGLQWPIIRALIRQSKPDGAGGLRRVEPEPLIAQPLPLPDKLHSARLNCRRIGVDRRQETRLLNPPGIGHRRPLGTQSQSAGVILPRGRCLPQVIGRRRAIEPGLGPTVIQRQGARRRRLRQRGTLLRQRRRRQIDPRPRQRRLQPGRLFMMRERNLSLPAGQGNQTQPVPPRRKRWIERDRLPRRLFGRIEIAARQLTRCEIAPDIAIVRFLATRRPPPPARLREPTRPTRPQRQTKPRRRPVPARPRFSGIYHSRNPRGLPRLRHLQRGRPVVPRDTEVEQHLPRLGSQPGRSEPAREHFPRQAILPGLQPATRRINDRGRDHSSVLSSVDLKAARPQGKTNAASVERPTATRFRQPGEPTLAAGGESTRARGSPFTTKAQRHQGKTRQDKGRDTTADSARATGSGAGLWQAIGVWP